MDVKTELTAFARWEPGCSQGGPDSPPCEVVRHWCDTCQCALCAKHTYFYAGAAWWDGKEGTLCPACYRAWVQEHQPAANAPAKQGGGV